MSVSELRIGPATIGGALGVRPGLLVGSIFYDGHSILTDALAGAFDEDRAAELLARVASTGRRYGAQMAVDVIAASPEAMERCLAFVGEHSDLPMLINATDPEARIAGLVTAAARGLLDRCVYASLNEDTSDDELDALRRHRPAAVMVLACDVADPTPEATCELVESRYQPMLDDIGAGTPIIDVGVMDPPSIGVAIRSIEVVRERFGYPAGCAFSNAIPQWKGLRALGRPWIDVTLAAALVACRAAGADFLHYGIIERARTAAHASSTADVFYGYAAREVDGATLPDDHPLRRMFRLAEA